MAEQKPERKYAWIDKWAKMTGERARIDAKVNKTAIVYKTEQGWVKEHYNGTIERINTEENRGEEMREKERIDRIMSLLHRIWEQQPDMRFNQLISNLQHIYSENNNGYGRRKMKEKGTFGDEVESAYLDFFYLEDDMWEEFLKTIVNNEGENR